MSNNLIRKGLAIGATVSLALAGLVGFAAPANAAGNVYLLPSEGSTYNVPIADNFSLQGYFDSAAKRGSESLKFRVTAAAGDLDIQTDKDGSGYAANYSATTNVVNRTSVAAASAATLHVERDLALLSTGVYIVTGGDTAAPTKSHLILKPAKTTDTFRVTVQAWMDFDGDDAIDSDEQASEVRTVSFVKTSDITASATSSVVAGATSVTTTVTTTPVLNGAQISGTTWSANRLTGSLTNNRSGAVMESSATEGTTWSETNQNWTVTNVVGTSLNINSITATTERVVTVMTAAQHGYSSGDSVRINEVSARTFSTDRAEVTVIGSSSTTFTYRLAAGLAESNLSSTATATRVVGDNAYTFVPYFLGTAVATGTASVPAAVTAATATATAPTTANQSKTTGTNTLAVSVRRATLTASASYTVKTSAGKAAAGQVVSAVVSGTALGKKVNGSTASTVTATSDANGTVTFNVETTSAANAETLVLTVTTGGVAATQEVITFTWATADYQIVDLGDVQFSSPTLARASTKGGSYTFDLAVLDQWRQPLQTANLRLEAAVTGRTVETKTVALANGRASYTVTDSGIGSGAFAAVTFTLQQLSGSTWGTPTTGAESLGAVNVNFYDGIDSVDLNADGVSSADLSDTRSADETEAVNGVTSAAEAFDAAGNTSVNITGSVRNAAALKAGARVTISGPSNILFVQGNVSAFGSLTFVDADGTIAVEAFSNIVQKDTVITVTSGSVSKTVKVSFVASTAAADADAFTITTAKSIKSGRTTLVTIKLADEFGNAINASQAVTVTSSGVGYLTSYPTTLTEGAATVVLVTGSGDFGKSTITVSNTALELSTTAAVWVGPVANAVAGADAGRVTIEAYRAKGKRVNVFVGSKRVASYVSNKAEFSKSVKVKTGTRNVRVVIQGPSSDFRGVIVVK